MKTKDAVEYFGSYKGLADFLNVWPHTPYRWGEVVPLSRACELHIRTEGRLDVGLDDYDLEEKNRRE